MPLYLGEIAPTKFRGMFGAMMQLILTIGILVANGASEGLKGSSKQWAYLFGIAGLLGVVQLLLSPLLVESPRWLIAKGNLPDALVVLHRLRQNERYNWKCADQELWAIEREVLGARGGDGGAGASGWGIPRYLWLPFGVLCALAVGQQLSGINAVFYFSTSFFADAGVSNPSEGTILAGAVNVLATAVAVALIEVAGRKILLFSGAAGMIVAAVVLTIVQALKHHIGVNTAGPVSIVCILAYVAAFEAGLGAIPWMIGGELFPEGSRGIAMSYAAMLNWLANFAVGLFFPRLEQALGSAYSFLPFAGILVLIALLVALLVPETRNKPVHAVLKSMGVRIPSADQDR